MRSFCKCPVFDFSDKCASTGKYACNNGGICKILEDGNVTCDCPRQFSGKECEIGIPIVDNKHHLSEF